MKTGGLALALALSFLLSIRAANVANGPAIEFTGVIVADGKTKIALTDRSTGTTEWIEADGNFRGYTVTRYDAKDDSITVKKDGREEQLRLVAAKSTANTTAPVTVAPPAPVVSATAPTSPNANLALPLPGAAANGNALAVAPPPATVNVSVITPPPPAAPEVTNYLVKEGDTLTSISTATGVSVDQLKLLNPGANPAAQLKAGEPIRTR